jgi:hypothetical protein
MPLISNTLLLNPSALEDEWAFDLLYCVAFVVMDKQWLEKNASYMDFNVSPLMHI